MKILVYDYSLNTEAAIKLAAAGHVVAYFSPWQKAFPHCVDSCVGKGLEGIERTDSLWPAVERSDIVVCFDTFSQDVVNHCKTLGKPVFGAGNAERLEQDRSFTKDLMKKVGLPVGKYVAIKGINSLIAHLKTVKDKFVKIDKYRGDIETFHHEDWAVTQNDILGPLLSSFGAYGDSIDFIVEDPIPSDVEIGFDGFVIDGHYSKPYLIGYEAKDKAYAGKIVPTLPDTVEQVNKRLAPYFAENKTRSIFSTEIRIGKDGKGYLIDPCVRAPHPPLAVELEIYENFAQLVLSGALGNVRQVTPAETYGVAVEIYSDQIAEHWCEISFDQKYRHLIKLQRACRINDRYYVLPGSFIAATVVGLGHTIDAAIKECCKALETVTMRGMTYDIKALENLRDKTIPAGRKAGINL